MILILPLAHGIQLQSWHKFDEKKNQHNYNIIVRLWIIISHISIYFTNKRSIISCRKLPHFSDIKHEITYNRNIIIWSQLILIEIFMRNSRYKIWKKKRTASCYKRRLFIPVIFFFIKAKRSNVGDYRTYKLIITYCRIK